MSSTNDIAPLIPRSFDSAEEWNPEFAIVKFAVQKACLGASPGFTAPSLFLLDFIVNTIWTSKKLYNMGYDK
ncbi:hypothetical protein N7475_001015 [Penicillium sp. IBT 31633x]|nr:hypothetical protein N7475_001015 [Penicillium sp. IBT 31633x]